MVRDSRELAACECVGVARLRELLACGRNDDVTGSFAVAQISHTTSHRRTVSRRVPAYVACELRFVDALTNRLCVKTRNATATHADSRSRGRDKTCRRRTGSSLARTRELSPHPHTSHNRLGRTRRFCAHHTAIIIHSASPDSSEMC